MKVGKKVFMGLSDIGSCISQWDEGLKILGIETLKGSIYQYPIQNSKLDFTIQRTKDKVHHLIPFFNSGCEMPWIDSKIESYYFQKAIKECDTFIFIYHSFTSSGWDLKYLRQLGKRIITLNVGDDVRWYCAMKQDFENANLSPIEYTAYDYSTVGLLPKLKYLRTAEKYSDIILGQPNYAQLALRPYFNLFIPINIGSINHNETQRKKPIVIHAPSSTAIKGTKYILPVIEKLKQENLNFEFKLIQNMPHALAMEEYLNADIIIDQLLCPGGGGLAYECLAMGKVVLTLMGYNKYDQQKPQDCPIVDIYPESLYVILKSLILDHPKRSELAKKGRPYIKKYHDPATIAKNLLDILSQPEQERKPDFYPTFFRDKFIPESAESIPVYNKWTEMVKDCDWYKKHVKPGERAGLVF